MEVLLEIIGELLLQVIVELLSEWGMHAVAEPFRKEPNPWLAALGYVFFGGVVGGLTLLGFPGHLTPSGPLRIANLILTPIVVGVLMAGVGAWRARRGGTLLRIDRFSYGYLFALALALVRFKFAS